MSYVAQFAGPCIKQNTFLVKRLMSEHLLHFLSNVITNQFLCQWSMHTHTLASVASKVHLILSFSYSWSSPSLFSGCGPCVRRQGGSSVQRRLQPGQNPAGAEVSRGYGENKAALS